ncbi:MAG: zinc-binding dehydrogenase [Verrucomicrobia bacterium]|nr:zinc-binding dehydrogenase [Verrucomicrobiota bacterium]
MKTEAIYFVGPRKTEIREVEVSDPQPHQVQVLCKATGICMAEASRFSETDKQAFPFVPGREGVGQVIRVGSDVKDIQPGQYVTCNRWQKIQNLDASLAHKIPGDPEDPTLWLVEPVARAVAAAQFAQVQAGDRVAIVGAGFMGLLVTQLIGRYPLYELVVTDVKAKNLSLAAEFGATETVNTTAKDGEARLEAIKKEPFDVVVAATCPQSLLDLGRQLCRRGGRYVIGVGDDAGSKGQFERAVRCMWRGLVDLKPLVTHRHKSADVQAAMEAAAQRGENYIKGALTF